MKLNEEAYRELENDIEAFLYIFARIVLQNPNISGEIVQQFKERIESIRMRMPAPQNSVVRFLNAEETKDTIMRLRHNLNSALQLVQTGLQIALVKSMDEFKQWRAEITNSSSGDVVKKLSNMTYNTKGNFKAKMEATGAVLFEVKDSNFTTEKTYTQHARGANVTEILEKSTVVADGDIDISTIAAGTTRLKI